MNEIIKGFENICDMEILQTHLSFIALFIGLYEYFADTVEERAETFFCDDFETNSDGEFKVIHNKEYREKIKNRRVDAEGHKDVLKSTMLWFVDKGAISTEDYERFLEIKKIRNSFTHQMTDYLWQGLSEDHIPYLFDLLALFNKLDKWWINEFEIPLILDVSLNDYDHEGVKSLGYMAYQLIINTLYGDESDEYVKIIADLKQGCKEKDETTV